MSAVDTATLKPPPIDTYYMFFDIYTNLSLWYVGWQGVKIIRLTCRLFGALIKIKPRVFVANGFRQASGFQTKNVPDDMRQSEEELQSKGYRPFFSTLCQARKKAKIICTL